MDVDPATDRMVPAVSMPPWEPLDPASLFPTNDKPDSSVLKEHFCAGGVIRPEDALMIIHRAASLLENEPNVLTLESPLTICGDVHGQYHDVMTIFSLGGDPLNTQYLFLGDYVDRGNFSTEIVLLLFAYKIHRPETFWMLRGNHECRHLTQFFNFKEECKHKYNEEVYDAFLRAFDRLPLAAVVGNSFLCVHGGLSPSIRSIDDINLIDRIQEPPPRGVMCDLLWADPMEEDEEELCPHALFLHNTLRQCSYVFSHAAATEFLKDNNLHTLIRAHEAQQEGFKMYKKVPETGMPSTVCVFSAPNYCDYDNKAAILQIDGQQLHLRQFHSVEHPYVLSGFINGFQWSMGHVCNYVMNVVQEAIEDSDESFPSAPQQAMVRSRFPASDSNSQLTSPVTLESLNSSFGSLWFYLSPRIVRLRGFIILAKIRAVARWLSVLRFIRNRKSSDVKLFHSPQKPPLASSAFSAGTVSPVGSPPRTPRHHVDPGAIERPPTPPPLGADAASDDEDGTLADALKTPVRDRSQSMDEGSDGSVHSDDPMQRDVSALETASSASASDVEAQSS